MIITVNRPKQRKNKASKRSAILFNRKILSHNARLAGLLGINPIEIAGLEIQVNMENRATLHCM